MSWKPVVSTDGVTFTGNAMCFETAKEALAWAADLYMRWASCVAYDAEESTDPVNYRITDIDSPTARLERIEEGQ